MRGDGNTRPGCVTRGDFACEYPDARFPRIETVVIFNLKLIGKGHEIDSNRGPGVCRGLIARADACGTNNGLNAIFAVSFESDAAASNFCLVVDPKAIGSMTKRDCSISRNSNTSLTDITACANGNVFDTVFGGNRHKTLLRFIL